MKEKSPLKNKTAWNQNIPEKDIRQFQTEIEAWKRLLNFRMEENILLKNTISDILKHSNDQNFLEEIEDFQTMFIKEDELIHSMRRELNDVEDLLYNKIFEDGKMKKLFDTKMENLSKDIANSTSRFRILKSAFNDFQHNISNKREN
ncbi:hypothetical protein [Agriterribacter sp.]|uniref:hypothetical protein n=1 Tax=Agriterribacter sp. TaxID=2821509 RepID=UPI002D1AD773|nr:hypothetical protein [Agriterribacter sp.]HRO46671.1 hypothetical protein [Agriterribacter sp.]HRQ16989.1 hypothetical protein [Agriterribacter sp.]